MCLAGLCLRTLAEDPYCSLTTACRRQLILIISYYLISKSFIFLNQLQNSLTGTMLFIVLISFLLIFENIEFAHSNKEKGPNKEKEAAPVCEKIDEFIADANSKKELNAILNELDLETYNFLLFRCKEEEQAEYNRNPYDLSNYGILKYGGLQGLAPVAQCVEKAPAEDTENGLCITLKAGDWLPKYIVERMNLNPRLKKLATFFENKFKLPNSQNPKCFSKLFSYLFTTVRHVAIEKLSENSKMLKRKTNLDIKQKLAFSSISFMAYIKHSELPQLSTSVVPNKEAKLPTLSAGLPHFVNGAYRNWGRDTFIALPGILLLTGRFEEARHIILGFAGVLRHGLIPNLLNGQGGKQPRYNARDAVWFWFAAIFRYIDIVPEGKKILDNKVRRIFPKDDSKVEDEPKKEETLKETMYEALHCHFKGIKFRERDAGPAIDGEMGDNGFNVEARIDHKTGLVFGGSKDNCGTWMDKMGSSPKNMSIPATPRDGAAVELQGLALLTAKNLAKLRESGLFHEPGLEANGTKWTWSEWAEILQKSFQDKFFIPKDTKESSPHVNKKGIVKDSFGCSNEFGDYQLRPNFFIALDAVPEILNVDDAWAAIKLAGEKLSGPKGMRTLDPEDTKRYRPDYYSDYQPWQEREVSKGWNYHQGPEWLWVAGKYHSAKLKVAHRLKTLKQGKGGKEEAEAKTAWDDTVAELNARIKTYTKHIEQDAWASLPELTNKDGDECKDSCNAQAWSVGCFMEALDTYDTLSGSK